MNLLPVRRANGTAARIVVAVGLWALASHALRGNSGDAAASLAPAELPTPRQYAPERTADILHLALEVTPDFEARTIAGQATLTFKPLSQPLRELRLDAVDLVVSNVTATEPVQAWQNTGKELVMTFAEAIPTDREVRVTVVYSAEPAKGLYFRTPELGYKSGETHLFTQGEAIEARHWYPSHDAPNEKFTSEVTCRVPAGMTVLSNGKLMSETADAASGRVAVRWLQDKPHVNYLVALVAGYFKKLEDTYRDIPLSFYTLPSAFPEAQGSFFETKDMMAFFEQETGVPYPWAKYAQVCVNDFVAGGMENTTLTILTDGTLFSPASENIHSSRGLVAHELAHMWFGDLVTCKDWSHLWLNEGFATYYEALYDGHKSGRDAFLYNLYNDAQGILEVPNDTRPIVHRRFTHPEEQFSYLAYPKGAWVVHMLRSQLGDELYRRCIRTYLERHQFGSVVTEDLNRVIEELSGRSFDRFFDQWVYHAHHPELEVGYAWDETAKTAKVTVRQVQALSDQVLLFQFPLPVRFSGASGETNRQILVKEKEEVFSFALPEAPQLVRLDPDYTLLAKIRFQPPPPMLALMLTNQSDLVGRLIAVTQWSARKDGDAIARLKTVLNQDPFYGVRLAASQGLRAAHTEAAREALLASTDQPDARVRRQVREDLGAFYHATVFASARAALEVEKNPEIQAVLVRTLGADPDPQVRELLLRYLKTESYRDVVADAALDAIRLQNDPSYIPVVLGTLQESGTNLTSGTFASGLNTLARLAHREDDQRAVREFLLTQLQHQRRSVQRAAMSALGELGDPKAIAALNTFARAAKDSPERQAAERALATLRAARKPVDDWQELRTEVLTLQKQNRDLERSLEELKKKVNELPAEKAPDREKDTKKKKK